jgi:hypothetical protein
LVTPKAAAKCKVLFNKETLTKEEGLKPLTCLH